MPGAPGRACKTICDLLGGLTLDTGRGAALDGQRGGCAVEGPTDWSRAAFANLGCLPQSERARWCVWKSVELLYLLCNPKGQEDSAPALERETVRRLAEICRYMEEHLDESLTISALSRRACLSTTTFRRGSVGCMVCRFIPGCASGGWSGRQSCCGIPPSVCWG